MAACGTATYGTAKYGTAAGGAAAPHWNAAWSAVPDSPGPALQAQTIRQVVRTSIAGTQVRIRLSNLYGTSPLTIGPVHLALHAGGAQIEPGSDHALTFGAKPTVTIAPGASILSDPVHMAVAAQRDLALSLYLPAPVSVSTLHGAGMQTAFINTSGDFTAAPSFTADKTDDSRYFLTDVEVVAGADARTLVVLGDSITDGIGPENDRNARWTDALTARLQADPALSSIAVVNAGIAGNRLLNDAAAPFVGPSALARVQRDAFEKPGVRWILLHEGINDITASFRLADPKDQVTVEQITQGLTRLAALARSKGVRIWGATLLPFEGTKGFYSEAAEARRVAVNAWIRQTDVFDVVVDFDLALRDPANARRLRPEFDSGDHLHPNEAGYQRMAATIDVQKLNTQGGPPRSSL